MPQLRGVGRGNFLGMLQAPSDGLPGFTLLTQGKDAGRSLAAKGLLKPVSHWRRKHFLAPWAHFPPSRFAGANGPASVALPSPDFPSIGQAVNRAVWVHGPWISLWFHDERTKRLDFPVSRHVDCHRARRKQHPRSSPSGFQDAAGQ